MKRITLLLVVAIVATTQLFAQKKVSPGIRAGVNVATLSNINADFKTDLYVGGILSLHLGQRYTLQPELIYTRQGANNVTFVDEETGTPTGQENVTIQYLSLGAINKFYFVDGFHGLIGPSLDMKIGKNFPRIDFDDDDYGGVDLGISLGLGYTLPIGLTFEGRFKTGMLDAFNNDYFLGMFDDPDDISLNRVFQLGLSYSF
ncbi:porin family protein [Parapedobacter sp. 10938]|uniref:porin family protein n=1 Tax=Parapedobacter flavus TaxID=3110225 RepID=UPI002DB6928E|nr:porin family protein [Parapedobacter sp. 10938]MEC3880875.1 porin family protein [Parapedobacter sp. 10938]